MKLAIFIIYLSMSLVGCSHLNKDKSSLNLDLVEKLKISQDTKNSALQVLGSPSKVFVSEAGQTIWVYYDSASGYQRATLAFEGSGKLQNLLWLIDSNHPEAKLEAAKARFSDSSFIVEDREWINPHISPNEILHIDYKKGVSLTLGIEGNDVRSISWFDPKDIPKKPTKSDYTFHQTNNGLVTIKPKKVENWSEIQVAREIASLK